jgi:hypothetical protein
MRLAISTKTSCLNCDWLQHILMLLPRLEVEFEGLAIQGLAENRAEGFLARV